MAVAAGVATVLGCLLAFWLPGTAVLRAARFGWLASLGLAPAVGAGALGIASTLCAAWGVRWGLGPAAVATGVLVAVVIVTGRVRRRPQPAGAGASVAPVRPVGSARDVAAGHGRLVLVLAVAAAVTALLLPVVIGMDGPGRAQNAWDALFHLLAVQTARADGVVSPHLLSVLSAPEGASGFYPHAWHAVASMVPTWAGTSATANISAFVPTAAAAVLGTASLARAVFPDRPDVTPVAAVLTASGLAGPLAVALQPGLIPNAFGLSLVPGVLALVVVSARAGRPDLSGLVCLAVAVCGTALSHPGAVLGLLVLSVPWAVGWLRRTVPAAHPRLRVPLVTVAVAVVVAGAALIASHPAARVVTALRADASVEPLALLGRLVTGDLGQWPSHPVVPTLLGALAAAALVRRRRLALPAAAVIATALYAAASSDRLAALTGLWYGEPRRLGPLVGLLVAVLAAYGVSELARVVRSHPGPLGSSALARGLPALLCAVCFVPGVVSLAGLADDTFSPATPVEPSPFDRVPYLVEGEDELLGRLAVSLDEDALLLGSSFSGSGHLHALYGQRVIQPYHTTTLPEQASYVSEHLGALTTDPTVCEAVRELGAAYVYVDPYPLHSTYWTTVYPASFTEHAPPGVDVVDRAGDVTVYSLASCF
ncbi:MAG: hypothetical protein JWP95_1374 [Actinotalea sp.]|nr:hypothetical protein [Actinotalea sp.]